MGAGEEGVHTEQHLQNFVKKLGIACIFLNKYKVCHLDTKQNINFQTDERN